MPDVGRRGQGPVDVGGGPAGDVRARKDLAGDASAARAALRALRGGEHSAGWGQILQDWYVGLFVAGTLLTMLFAATGPSILRPDCATTTCLTDEQHLWLAAGMSVLGTLAAALALRATGPAWSDPDRMTWLASTPADRGVLLRGGVARVGVVAVIATGAWGVLVGFSLAVGLGVAQSPVVPVLVASAAGVVVGLLLTAGVLAWQGRTRPVLPAVRAVPDAELLRAGQVAGAVGASTLILDGAALEVVSTRRRLARRGRYRSRAGAGGAVTGALVHECRALLRRWPRVLTGLAACAAALVVGLLLGRLAGVLVTALVTLLLARVAGGGVRTWVATPGLRRAVPAHPAAVAAALAVPPFVMVGVGSALALLPLGLGWWAPVAVGLGITAAAVRAAEPPPAEMGVVLATPAGPLSSGLVRSVVHGPDLALAVGVLVLAADARGLGVLALAGGSGLLAWQVLRPRG